VGAVYIVLVAIDSRPIADDWWFASVASHQSLWSSFRTYWNDETDRFSALAITALALKLFNLAAVNVVPVVALGLVWAALTRAVALFESKAGRVSERVSAASVGLVATVAIVASAPGLFDTAGWLTSTVSYLAGVSGAAWLAVWAVTPHRGRGRPYAALAAALGFAVSGFHELIGAMIVIAAALAALSSALGKRRAGHEHQGTACYAAVCAGALVGVLTNLLGPGTSVRASNQHAHIAVASAARTASNTLSFITDDLHRGIFALALAAGVLAWCLVGVAPNRYAQRRLLGAIVFLIIVPWLVSSAMTAWGGSLEPGYRLPFRVAFLTTGSVAFALILAVPATLYYQPRLLSEFRAALLALVLGLIGLVGFVHRANPIITAERMRAPVVARRNAMIRTGLAERRSSILIEPAPLLTAYTEVYDLPFGASQLARTWNLDNLRAYFGIPRDVELIARTNQPHRYCLPDVTASWMGLQSCQELQAEH
jgi:hypothetical protein